MGIAITLHRNSGRSGNTSWKSIVGALNNKITVHRVRTRVKQLLDTTPKKTTKPKQSAVVEIEDDDNGVRYDARFDKLESQMSKVTEQWSMATAENAKFRKQNKSLQDENNKLNVNNSEIHIRNEIRSISTI